MNNTARLHRLTESSTSLLAALRLVALPSIGISRSRWLLGSCDPELVVESLLRGMLPPDLPDPKTRVNQQDISRWSDGLRGQDPDEIRRRNMTGGHASSVEGHTIMDAGHEHWPFHTDPDPPVLLFAMGRLEVLANRHRIGVVGTRRCSGVGRQVAGEIGWTLAEAGVSVVSGLALGVDGAVHRGAGSSATDPGRVGVVASGLDMVYPHRNASLWQSVAETGVVISETPMGERATRWRFPARNRLIAGLSQLVVVVESHDKGGALITVDEAAARGVDVVAVPGSVLASSCRGTNQLLMDGVAPVRDGADVLYAAGIDACKGAASQTALFEDKASPLKAAEQEVVTALGGGPMSVDHLAEHLGSSALHVSGVVQRLARQKIIKIDGSVVALPLGEGD